MEKYIIKGQDSGKNSKRKCGILKGTAIFLWETAKIIIISLAIIIPVRYFLIQPFFFLCAERAWSRIFTTANI
jgi:hypothetical protein